jgi:hypothetical protein
MVLNKKNIISTILLAGLLVPFILITDIFPFLRFGMFAEPIKSQMQTEKFILYCTNTKGEKIVFNPTSIGINSNTFHYLCRNYYYRNETKLFSKKIFLSSKEPIQEIEIKRVTSSKESSDTLTIGIFNRNE